MAEEGQGQNASESLSMRVVYLAYQIERAWQERLYVHGLNTREHWVLVICSELGPCTAVEIATRVPIDPASISRTVHSLVQRNLLARRRSRVDRRQVMLRVTPDGQEHLRRLSQALNDYERELTQAISESEARRLIASIVTQLQSMGEG